MATEGARGSMNKRERGREGEREEEINLSGTVTRNTEQTNHHNHQKLVTVL